MRPLTLGDQREPALEHAAALVARAWREFDPAREVETVPSPSACSPGFGSRCPSGPATSSPTSTSPPTCSTPRSRSRARATSPTSARAASRSAHSPTSSRTRTTSTSPSTPAAATQLERQTIEWLAHVPRLPGGRRLVHQRRHHQQHHGARRRARAGPARAARTTGMRGERVALYCSAEAHYSVTRAAELLGIGRDNVRAIPIDDRRRMSRRPASPTRSTPTSRSASPRSPSSPRPGTTLTGAVDPIDAIADVCASAASGCTSTAPTACRPRPRRPARALFAGLDRVDSLSVDAHKWMFVPKACSAVLVRRTRRPRGRLLARRGVHPARGRRAQRRRRHPRVLPAVPRAQAVARPARARRRRRSARRSRATSAQAQLPLRPGLAHPDFQTREHPPQLSIVPDPPRRARAAPISTATTTSSAAPCSSDGRVYISPAMIDGRTWLRPCFTNFRTRPRTSASPSPSPPSSAAPSAPNH